ncbi:iron-containing alcohol dehydrogenase [Lentisphaerota bacterium WC36G]|nr:iron-containing alcohol dehydrogenase [Lentisphaerae bacterium WC36]
MWKSTLDCQKVVDIRLKTTVFLGCGAINKIDDIATEMSAKKIDKVIIVTGKSAYKRTGAWNVVVKALENNSIEYVLYDKSMPNPTVDQVDEAAAMGREFGAQLVIGIGGGSAIDTAKSAAIIMANPEQDARALYNFEFIPTEAVPIVAVNLTHGTGTEVNRVAVASIPESNHKPAIVYDCIYPWYSIDDPNLMISLSEFQTLSTSVDAVNHAIEAATTLCNSPFSVQSAAETIAIVAEYLPKAIKNPNDTNARYWLTYAALMAGASFDNGLLHITHALEHPLSALHPEFTHGAGLGMLLPAVVKEIFEQSKDVLAYILKPIVGNVDTNKANAAEQFEIKIEEWLFSLGLTDKLSDEGFTAKDVENLTNLAFTTPSLDVLLSLSPIAMNAENVANIYKNSLFAKCAK